MVMKRNIISIVEDNIAEDIYQKLKNTDLAKNAFIKCPQFKNDIRSFAKQLAEGGMRGQIGDNIDILLQEKNITGFKEACQRALERALLLCFEDFINGENCV